LRYILKEKTRNKNPLQLKLDCDNEKQPFAYFDKRNQIVFLIIECNKRATIYCLNLKRDNICQVDLFQQVVCSFSLSAISVIPTECLNHFLGEISR